MASAAVICGASLVVAMNETTVVSDVMSQAPNWMGFVGKLKAAPPQ